MMETNQIILDFAFLIRIFPQPANVLESWRASMSIMHAHTQRPLQFRRLMNITIVICTQIGTRHFDAYRRHRGRRTRVARVVAGKFGSVSLGLVHFTPPSPSLKMLRILLLSIVGLRMYIHPLCTGFTISSQTPYPPIF